MSGLRAAALQCMTFTVAAVTVQRLLVRIRRHEEMLGEVVELTRGLDGVDDLRAHVANGVRRLAEADIVVLSEVDGSGRLRITGSTDHSVVGPPADAPPSWTAVLELDEPVFASRTDHDRAPLRSVLHQPMRRADTVVGVLTLGWSEPRSRPPNFARRTVELVAAEASAAIERAELMRRVTNLARYDDLTGLANRRTWDEHLTMEMSRADRTDTSLCVALLDLDRFKQYNDEHGHLGGDRLLKSAAAAWSSQLRPTDLLARWGGEEFVLALPNTALDEALVVVDRLRATTPMGQTFSAGVTEVGGRDAMAVMQAADSALYLAKESGRNRVIAFDHTGRELSAAGR